MEVENVYANRISYIIYGFSFQVKVRSYGLELLRLRGDCTESAERGTWRSRPQAAAYPLLL